MRVELLETRALLSVTIQFDYTYDNTGFFAAGSAARSVLEQAGQYLGTQINDHLLAIPADPGPGNSWSAVAFDPRNIDGSLTINNLPVPADTIILYAGATSLPSGVVGEGGTGGYSYSGTDAWGRLVEARGQAGALATPKTDIGPWGGTVTFDTNTSFGFTNLGSPPVNGKVDFLAVALHEIGHVLGLVPGSADYALVDHSTNTFLGKHSDASYGGPVPLDGLDVHWASGTMSYGSPAIMDPEVAFDPQGARYTSLDWGGLEDTGWETDSLVVSTQPPTSVSTGTGFGVAISAVDPDGRVDTAYTGTIALALANNPGGAILGGTLTAPVVDGVATFSGLTLDQPGSGYTLRASAADDTPPVVSAAFGAMRPRQATELLLTGPPPSSVAAGVPFGLTVSATNASLQVAPNFNGPVTLALLGSTGATLGGPLTVQASGGVAVFSGLTLSKVGSGYTIQASSGGLTPTSTNGIAVTPGPVAKFTLSTSNGGQATQGVAFPLTVTAFDAFGDVVTNYSGTVHPSSTDPQATLPADYTFVPNDQGVHVFQPKLATPGAQSLTFTDTKNSMANGVAQVQVNPPTPSKTTLSVNLPGSTYGQKVTFQATVTSGIVNGTVTFLDGSTVLGRAAVASGVASFSTTSLTVGTHSITASYGGSVDGTIAASTSPPLSFLVKVGTTTGTLSPSTGSTSPNQAVTLAIVVNPILPSLALPTGTVKFFDGATSLGSATLVAGQATLVVPSLGLGTHSITATYSGDANYAAILAGSTSVYSGDGLKDDFDGDGKADLAVYGKDPATGRYRFEILTSSTNFASTKAVVFDNQGFGFGNASSIPVAADYFGDGKAAYAIFSPTGPSFMIFQAISAVNPAKALSINFGLTSDSPVIADVDGDGKADFGVFGYDPNLGYRYDFLLSSKGFDPKQPLIFNNYGYGYGTSAASPVVADFDGSGHAGFGVYIPSGNTGTFTYTNVTIPSGTTGPIVDPPPSAYFARTYGFSNDIPMAVDYDGDGKSDLAFYGLDPRTGRYRYDILTSSTSFDTTKDVYFDNAGFGYGYSASIPVMADFEGAGHADFAVFQPDGLGGASYVFQDVGVGHGVVYDFATATDLPADAPAPLLARKVRGH